MDSEKIDWGMIAIYGLWVIAALLVLGFIPLN